MISPRAQYIELKSCPFCTIDLVIIDLGGKGRLACAHCEFVHWNNPKPVTATLVPMDGGIVLVKRKFEPFIGSWCLPGGFIETAEHPAESAEREVLEETGLQVKVTRLLEADAPGRGINVVILFYEALPIGGELIAGDDASEVGAFKQSELPQDIAFDGHKQIIQRWFEAASRKTAPEA